MIASLDVQLARRVSGQRGTTVSGTDASGVLTLSQLIDHRPDRQVLGSLKFDIAPAVGRLPYAVRPVADLLLALAAGSRLRLRLGAANVGYAELDDGLLTEPLIPMARLVVALDELQRRFGNQFPLPTD